MAVYTLPPWVAGYQPLWYFLSKIWIRHSLFRCNFNNERCFSGENDEKCNLYIVLLYKVSMTRMPLAISVPKICSKYCYQCTLYMSYGVMMPGVDPYTRGAAKWVFLFSQMETAYHTANILVSNGPTHPHPHPPSHPQTPTRRGRGTLCVFVAAVYCLKWSTGLCKYRVNTRRPNKMAAILGAF